MRACVCVVSVIVKRPVLPPSVVDGRSRNPLYYYYYYILLFYKSFCRLSLQKYKQLTMALSQACNLLRYKNLSGDLTDDCVNKFMSFFE